MAESKVVVQGPSVSIAGLLGVAFVVLKLCHVIEWSWLWVLAPFWIPMGLVFAFLAFVFVVAILAAVLKK